MIGIITQNNTILSVLTSILGTATTEKWQKGHAYDVVLLVSPTPQDLPDLSDPIITFGIHHPTEAFHLDGPLSPQRLQQKIKELAERVTHIPSFENQTFLFQGKNRTLIHKGTKQTIALTEKENALICALATAFPNSMTKEALLVEVWNYHPNTETHTLESHIYALRQKIGSEADLFLQSTPAGYTLVQP